MSRCGQPVRTDDATEIAAVEADYSCLISRSWHTSEARRDATYMVICYMMLHFYNTGETLDPELSLSATIYAFGVGWFRTRWRRTETTML